MVANLHCSICAELNGKPAPSSGREYTKLISQGRTILFRGDHVSVIPSIGPLSISHLLIVSNRHELSMAALSGEGRTEMKLILDRIRFKNSQHFHRDTLFFEHGTGRLNSWTGACIEHAHMHCIFSVEEVAIQMEREFQMTRLQSMEAALSVADVDRGYIMLHDYNHTLVRNGPVLPPQYFRMLYSRFAMGPQVWNWRSDLRVNLIKEILAIYEDKPFWKAQDGH